MGNKALWTQFESWKKDYKWVDLTRELSPETPHWSGFPDMIVEVPFDYPDGFFVHKYTVVSQYGTHIDAPCHFPQGRRTLDQIMPEEMVLPLCVIDITDKVNENVDYVFGVQDILDWEAVHGQIPEGAFVAMQTGWSKREDINNYDENGIKHFPGWGIPALEFLAKERKVKAVGHEPADTDPGVIACTEGYVGEYYILDQECYQVELMINLDQVPPIGSLIFVGFPKAKDSPGFTARCIALCPNE